MATYEISIGGRGRQLVIGNITRAAHDFWIDQPEESVHAHLFDDAYSMDNGNPIHDTSDVRFMGDWWANDTELSVHGALDDYLYIEVTDESGNIVWTTDTVDAKIVENVNLKELAPGNYIKAWIYEKGQFFVANIYTPEFDSTKLKFFATQVDGDSFVTHATYNNVSLDNEGGNTDQKSHTYEFHDVE